MANKKSFIEVIPEVVREGRREIERIFTRLQSDHKIPLQINKYALPSKAASGMFTGQVELFGRNEWFNRLIVPNGKQCRFLFPQTQQPYKFWEL